MERWLRIAGGMMVLGGVATMALATGWQNPCSQMSHNNSSTCNSEECARCCRICCTHYHPDTTTAAWSACQALCDQVPSDCPD